MLTVYCRKLLFLHQLFFLKDWWRCVFIKPYRLKGYLWLTGPTMPPVELGTGRLLYKHCASPADYETSHSTKTYLTECLACASFRSCVLDKPLTRVCIQINYIYHENSRESFCVLPSRGCFRTSKGRLSHFVCEVPSSSM